MSNSQLNSPFNLSVLDEQNAPKKEKEHTNSDNECGFGGNITEPEVLNTAIAVDNISPKQEDDQEPCTSKSIAGYSKPRVRFDLKTNQDQETGGAPIRSINSQTPLTKQARNFLGPALSDSILTVSSINSAELLYQWGNVDTNEENDYPEENVSNDGIPLPSRSPTKAFHSKLQSIASGDGHSRTLFNNNIGDRKEERYEDDMEELQRYKTDINNNDMVQWISQSEKRLYQHASYLFHPDNSEHIAKTLDLLPRDRQYAVFNVFTDIARVFGYKRRKKRKVAFPEEVLENYEQKGETAGPDRFLSHVKQPYHGLSNLSFRGNKKRRLSAVYTNWKVKKGGEFAPRVTRIENHGRCEYWCERNCISCDCCDCSCCSCCRKSSKKEMQEDLMQGYTYDLNLASLFLHSHAARTFETAIGDLELVKLHAFSMTSMTLSTSKKLCYNKQRISVLSTSVWIFGYCIRDIVDMARNNSDENSILLPSESGFSTVLKQFAGICMTVNQSAHNILRYSKNFYNFCKECIRLLKILQIHLGFRFEFKLNKPLRYGDGLELNRKLSKRDISKQGKVNVRVARVNPINPDDNVEQDREWKNYEDNSAVEKIYSLRQLLGVVTETANTVQTQLRFLIDDIIDSLQDLAEPDFLHLLAEMHDRIRYLENKFSKKQRKADLEILAKHMKVFCSDFQCFMDVAHHIMKRFVEFRDMVHVTYELFSALKIDFTEMVPPLTFKKKKSCLCGCGGGGNPNTFQNKRHMPKYNPMDFFRVYYNEAFDIELTANKFYFSIRRGTDKIKEVIPKGANLCNWGLVVDGVLSPRTSLEEYMDPEETDEEIVMEPIPIIKPASSPVASPRGSIGLSENVPPTSLQVDGKTAETSGATGDKAQTTSNPVAKN